VGPLDAEEVKDWDDGKGIDVDSWICCIGNFEHAIGYARLFWPEFIRHDGCVFHARLFDEKNYINWLEHLKGDRRAVQAVMNHRHIISLFGDSSLDPTQEQIL
jgi:hypothetical protein